MIKDIPGYEGKYAITDDGQVYTYHRKKYLKPCITKDGYYEVKLRKDGRMIAHRVHCLVLMTYNPHEKYKEMQVNHKDENKLNNNLQNLEWMTCKENINYGTGIERRAKKNENKVKCVETGQIFESQKTASEFYGYKNMSNISSCLNGRQKTFAGYHWERVMNNEN